MRWHVGSETRSRRLRTLRLCNWGANLHGTSSCCPLPMGIAYFWPASIRIWRTRDGERSSSGVPSRCSSRPKRLRAWQRRRTSVSTTSSHRLKRKKSELRKVQEDVIFSTTTMDGKSTREKRIKDKKLFRLCITNISSVSRIRTSLNFSNSKFIISILFFLFAKIQTWTIMQSFNSLFTMSSSGGGVSSCCQVLNGCGDSTFCDLRCHLDRNFNFSPSEFMKINSRSNLRTKIKRALN